MKRRLRHLRRRPSLRAAVAALALVNYVALAIGLPLPQPAARVASSTPFPCQHHQCGCQSAEQCWSNCCCFTPRERLAWAKRHLQFVPEGLAVALAEDEKQHATQHNCCHHSRHDEHESDHHKDDHCDGDQLAQHTDHDCDEHEHDHLCDRDQACGRTSSQYDAQPHSGIKWVVWFEAQKCRGGVVTWLGVPCSVPPDALQHMWNEAPKSEPVLFMAEPHILSLRAAPPDPPPRLV